MRFYGSLTSSAELATVEATVHTIEGVVLNMTFKDTINM